MVFAVGSSAIDSKSIPDIRNRNLTEEDQKKIKFYYFRGGYHRKALTLPSKIIMSVVSKLVFEKLRKERPEFSEILNMMKNGGDYTQAADISSLKFELNLPN